MADNVLRIKIEDDGDDDTRLDRPGDPADRGPSPSPPSNASPPPWYDEFRQLRNRADVLGEQGKRLGAAEDARLGAMTKLLNALAAGGAEAALAGQVAAAEPAADRPPPGPPAPPPQPAADRTPAPGPARDDLAGVKEFLLASKDVAKLGMTRQTVEAMDPAFARDLAGQLGYQPAGAEPARDDAGESPKAAADRAVGEVLAKLERNLLTLDEAFERVGRVVGKAGDKLTDDLREKGTVGRDKTAADYYKERVEDAAERSGNLPVAERRATVVSSRPAPPVGKPVTDEYAAEVEGREARADEMRRMARTRQAAEGARAMSHARTLSGAVSGGMQVAASGALGEGAAAAAGGPAGLAVMAALALKEARDTLLKRPFEAAREGIGTAGQMARDVAGGNGAALADRGANLAGNALAKLGPVGIVAGESLKVFGTGVKEATATVAAFVARGREIADFNGRLAAAAANADVAALRRDMREADRLGPRFAELIDAQANAEDRLAEALLPVKEELLRALTAATDVAASVVELLRDLAPTMQALGDVLKFLSPPILVIANWMGDVAAEAKAQREAADKVRRDEQDKAGFGVDAMLAALDNLHLGAVQPNPDQGRIDRQLIMPIFGGK